MRRDTGIGRPIERAGANGTPAQNHRGQVPVGRIEDVVRHLSKGLDLRKNGQERQLRMGFARIHRKPDNLLQQQTLPPLATVPPGVGKKVRREGTV